MDLKRPFCIFSGVEVGGGVRNVPVWQMMFAKSASTRVQGRARDWGGAGGGVQLSLTFVLVHRDLEGGSQPFAPK